MDKESVVYTHNGDLLSNSKKNEITLFAGKWMDLGIMTLSEISHSH
jgi:hypothetical protein